MSREGVSPAEAAALIVADAHPLPVEVVPLHDALARVLSAPITSPIDIPAWDNSAMDGYAVRSADVQVAPVTLRIIETVAAGQFPARALKAGETTRIFTGAPLPEGCDGVIRQEDTTAVDAATVRINQNRDAGRNLRFRGEDIRRGAMVLEDGVELGPAHLGVISSLAQATVPVRRRPLVAILGSGDEIADLDEADAIRAGKKIASSNTYTLTALLRQNGAEVLNLGIARDDPADLRARLAKATDADVIVTSAGVSVGEHDHVRTVLDELGMEPRFWRIRMRPGAPVGYGLLRGRPWIGLPGNPVSTMVTFDLFVRPLLRKLIGHRRLFRRPVAARTTERIVLGPRLRHYLRAVVTEGPEGLEVKLTGPQGSAILTSMVKANALLIVPEDRPEVTAGEMLQAILLNETTHLEEARY
jgi:molybdopterin molybdotransferase